MHDARKRPLKTGDVVLIPARIEEVFPTEDFCNVSCATIIGRRPDGAKEYFSGINTGVMLRANPGDSNDLDNIEPETE